MDREVVSQMVIEAVRQVQTASGRSVGSISLTTCPISDLEGFDSLSGVEATVMLCESLGHDLPDDYNPFLSKDGRRALSVSEITNNLCEIIRVRTTGK